MDTTIKVGDLVETDIIFEEGCIHTKYGRYPKSTQNILSRHKLDSLLTGVFKVIEVTAGSVIIATGFNLFFLKIDGQYYGVNGWFYAPPSSRKEIVCAAIDLKYVKLFTGKLCPRCQFVCQQQCRFGLVKLL